MNILVIDGMGGGLGKSVVESLRERLDDAHIIAVGTNSLATSAMLKAGAHVGATGENAVVYNSTQADVIIGAMGILLANAMHGEISPKMAQAIGESGAQKMLIPIGKCSLTIAGLTQKPLAAYIDELAQKLILTKDEKSV